MVKLLDFSLQRNCGSSLPFRLHSVSVYLSGLPDMWPGPRPGRLAPWASESCQLRLLSEGRVSTGLPQSSSCQGRRPPWSLPSAQSAAVSQTLPQVWAHLLLSVPQAFPAPARPLHPRFCGLHHRGWLAQCHQNGPVQGQLPHCRLHLPSTGHRDDIRVSDEHPLCLAWASESRLPPHFCHDVSPDFWPHCLEIRGVWITWFLSSTSA